VRNVPIGQSVAEMRDDTMNEEPLEYNYVVYEPTSNELGIVLGVFVDAEQAAIFIKGYFGTYGHEPSLCIKKVPVNDDTCIQRYIQPKRGDIGDKKIGLL